MREHGFKRDKPVAIDVYPFARVEVYEGNHRIRAAAKAGVPVRAEVRYLGGAELRVRPWEPPFVEAEKYAVARPGQMGLGGIKPDVEAQAERRGAAKQLDLVGSGAMLQRMEVQRFTALAETPLFQQEAKAAEAKDRARQRELAVEPTSERETLTRRWRAAKDTYDAQRPQDSLVARSASARPE